MKSETPSLQTLIQNYFLQRLIQQRKVSYQTVSSYKDTFRIYLQYLNELYGLSATEADIQQISKRALLLPAQKHEQPSMDFITKTEFNSLIDVCDIETFIGSRDKLMLMIMYNTGTRVSELQLNYLIFIMRILSTM